jgi:hypothetical protein
MIQCAWAATKTRNTRLSLWYWRNMPRLGDKKAITAVARKLLCYIYAMLKSGTMYDKSLDVAYSDKIGAIKLDAAHKIVGSRKSSAQLPGKGGNNRSAPHAPGLDTIINKQGLTIAQADSGNQPYNGIESPSETATPKKRGRPKKAAPSG